MTTASRHVSVRQQLLRPTLEFCAQRVPWYREAWGSAWQKVQTAADLRHLPLLDKRLAVRVQDKLRSGVEPLPTPVLSSGTMRAAGEIVGVLEMLHSNEELDKQDRWLEELAQSDVNAAGGENARAETSAQLDLSGAFPPRRELVIVDAHRGLPFERSSPLRVLVPFTPHDNSLLQIRRLLERSFEDSSRFEAMLISVDNLKALTLWLLERGEKPSSFAVRSIGTSGQPLSGPWRDRLQRLWDAQLWDNYAISEVRSAATECPTCGHLHFDQVPVVCELVDPLTGATREDWGELVLTTLFPYAQAMPLVRYRTGDVVALDDTCETGEPGFTFLGRADRCGYFTGDDEETLLVFAQAPLLDFCDAHPDVARRTHRYERLDLVPPGTLGEPDVEVTTTASGGSVRIELAARLRYHPEVFPDRAAHLRDELITRLVHALPALEDEVAMGNASIDVTLLPPASEAS
jgi:hypothetical protein